MKDRLLRPTLLESHTAMTRLAMSTIARLTLQQIGRAQSILYIKSIDSQEQNVGIQPMQRFFRDRSHQGE